MSPLWYTCRVPAAKHQISFFGVKSGMKFLCRVTPDVQHCGCVGRWEYTRGRDPRYSGGKGIQRRRYASVDRRYPGVRYPILMLYGSRGSDPIVWIAWPVWIAGLRSNKTDHLVCLVSHNTFGLFAATAVSPKHLCCR